MLDSLYEKALKKKDALYNKLKTDFENIKIDPGNFWIDMHIGERKNDIVISGGDGSRNWKEFLGFVVYAINTECLIYDGKNLQKVECCDIDVINPYKYVKNRLETYMSIYEIKSSLKALKDFNVDLTLFDGSLLGKIIRPSPMENTLPEWIKNEIRLKYLNKIEKSLENELDLQIISPKLFSSMDIFGENIVDSIIYLESLENLLTTKYLLKEAEKKGKDVVSISKTSTRTDYPFNSNIPDMAIFDRFSKKQGYSKPLYLNASDRMIKRIFPIYDKYFKDLTFTIFYARFDDFKNILKFELPYRATEEDIILILESLKGICAEGYPYLLKKAHNDVVLQNRDMKNILRMMGFHDPDLKTGREML
ncbi:MAG: DNA double-strand break repair nuclease NurA [Methanobacteriaceae archaeon]